MSDTTGWEIGGGESCRKIINGNWFYCFECNGIFELAVRGVAVATRPTLRECQILAHDTARLWSGSDE